MKDAMLVAEGLTLGWDHVVLLEDASFSVARGDVFVIVGFSGSGKSTLLRYLVGLDTPKAGRVWIDGKVVEDARSRAPTFGVMFQSGALFGSLTVGENVALPLRQWTTLPDDAIEAIVAAQLGLVGLEQASDKMPAELSGGMKKRAAIARALALDPPLLFLDEPSAGLDPVTSAELDELILTLKREQGLTVVVVSHELESIFKIADDCIMLDRESRTIIARGHPRELRDARTDTRVHGFFNRMPRETRS